MPPLPHYLEIVRRNYSRTMYAAIQVAEMLKRYHRFEVHGMENVPEYGAAIMVTNHSFATYDGFLLGSEIFRQRGRAQWALADRLIFKVPGLRETMTKLHWIEGSREAAKQLLKAEKMLWVAPGGMREALRSSRERYQVRWETRTGFVRLSLETGAPIVLCACPAADDIFTLYPNPVTPVVYRNFRLPFAFWRGWGPTPLPRRVTLTHHIAAPLVPPKIAGERATDEEVRAFHGLVVAQMQALMARAVEQELPAPEAKKA